MSFAPTDVDAPVEDASVDLSMVPTLVQAAGNAAVGVTTLSTTLSSAPSVDDVLVLVGAGHFGPIVPPSGGSAAWVRAAISAQWPNIEIWVGVADGSSTVTIGSTGPTGMTLWVGAWAGLATTGSVDDFAAANATTSPASAGTITISAAPALVIFAVNSWLPNTFGVPTGGTWTELDTQIGDSMQRVWFDIAPTTGEVAPSVDETQHKWDAAIVALRLAP